MESASFIRTFLYPDFSRTADIRPMLDPFRGRRRYSSTSSESSSDSSMSLSSSSSSSLSSSTTSLSSSDGDQELENQIKETVMTVPTIKTVPIRGFSLTKQMSSDTTPSPLDDKDLIDIILKHGVHRELKSLNLIKEVVQEPPTLSPVKESSDDTSAAQKSKIVQFKSVMWADLKDRSLGCFKGRIGISEEVIPLDGLRLGVYLLFSDEKDRRFINSYKFYGMFDVVENFVSVSSTWKIDDFENAPIGIGYTSFIFSDNTPEFLLEIVSSITKQLPYSFEFLVFIDVLSDSLCLECFDASSFKPMFFNLCH